MDTFLEYMIKQRRSKKTILKCILLAYLTMIVTLFLTMVILMFPMFLSIWPLMIFFLLIACYKLISRFDVEYEYTLTNGELDVDKIVHKKKRYRVVSVHSKTFTHFGKVSDKEYKNLDFSSFLKVINANANSPMMEDYYAVFYDNGQKTLLIFNPTGKMIESFKFFNKRVVNKDF